MKKIFLVILAIFLVACSSNSASTSKENALEYVVDKKFDEEGYFGLFNLSAYTRFEMNNLSSDIKGVDILLKKLDKGKVVENNKVNDGDLKFKSISYVIDETDTNTKIRFSFDDNLVISYDISLKDKGITTIQTLRESINFSKNKEYILGYHGNPDITKNTYEYKVASENDPNIGDINRLDEGYVVVLKVN